MKMTIVKEQKAAFWSQHIDLANQYPDGILKYCEVNGLACQTFYKWKLKLKSRGRQTSTKLAAMSPFAEVQVCKPEVMRGQSLPDARWLAEFILHMNQGAQ